MPVVILLFVAFLVLKLMGVIAWSWWWITAPLWSAGILSLFGLLVFGTFWALLSKLQDRWNL